MEPGDEIINMGMGNREEDEKLAEERVRMRAQVGVNLRPVQQQLDVDYNRGTLYTFMPLSTNIIFERNRDEYTCVRLRPNRQIVYTCLTNKDDNKIDIVYDKDLIDSIARNNKDAVVAENNRYVGLRGFFRYITGQSPNIIRESGDYIRTQLEGLMIFTPYDTICSVLMIRSFLYDCGAEFNLFTSFPPMFAQYDININTINTISNDLLSTTAYEKKIQFIYARFKYSDYLNANLFSKLSFPAMSGKFATRYNLAMYDYLKYPQLTLDQVCQFFNVKALDVVHLYVDSYACSATNVMLEFESSMHVALSDLTDYLYANLATLQKYLDINYLTAVKFSNVYMALFCYLLSCNKLGIFVILNFLEKMKLRGGNEITMSDTEYNRVNYFIDRQFNTFYKQDSEYKVVNFKKDACTIATNTIPPANYNSKCSSIKTNLKAESFLVDHKCNTIDPVRFDERLDEIKVVDSYILTIGKQTAAYMQEIYPYLDTAKEYFAREERRAKIEEEKKADDLPRRRQNNMEDMFGGNMY